MVLSCASPLRQALGTVRGVASWLQVVGKLEAASARMRDGWFLNVGESCCVACAEFDSVNGGWGGTNVGPEARMHTQIGGECFSAIRI